MYGNENTEIIIRSHQLRIMRLLEYVKDLMFYLDKFQKTNEVAKESYNTGYFNWLWV